MTKAEMSKFNISPDEDSSSYSSNSNDCRYLYEFKAYNNSPSMEGDPENQNFLPKFHIGKKKYEIEYHPGTTSFGMSTFNLSNVIMGSGILGLSYAMANTGIILFVILLVVVAILSLYSVHLLLKTANEGGSLLYEQLGMKAFGLAGKFAASGSITMQNIGAMSSYLYIVKYELPLVIKAFMNIEDSTGEWYLNGDYLVVLVSTVLILPLSLLKNLGYLGYTSGLSLMCMVFFLIVVIWKKFQIPCPLDLEYDMMNTTLNGTLAYLTNESLHGTVQNLTSNMYKPKYVVVNSSVIWKTFPIPSHTPIPEDMMNTTLSGTLAYLTNESLRRTAQNITSEMCRPKYFVFNSQTVYAVPILTFSFVCHPAILPIYEELKGRSRRRMMNVSTISFFSMFIMYLLAALFGYLTFFDNVEAELLHTYSAVLGTDVIILIVRLAVLTAVTLTVPVVVFPIRTSITQLFCAEKEFSWLRHCFITLFVLAFTNVLVIFVPSIRDIFGFIGASAAAMLIFILPSAFYIKLVKKERMKSVQKIGAILFLLSGILVMTGSMTLIIIDWIHNYATDGY